MIDTYYPKHAGEQGVTSEELHIAWLEDRVRLLEELLSACQSEEELRAEVKKLRRQVAVLQAAGVVALREVAEKQREACAQYMEQERWYTSRAALSAPLVTEEKP